MQIQYTKNLKAQLKAKKNKNHFFIFCTMHNNVFKFFLAYLSFFPLKRMFFFSDFGLSALRLRKEESAVILADYDIRQGDKGKTCENAPYRSIMTDVYRKY